MTTSSNVCVELIKTLIKCKKEKSFMTFETMEILTMTGYTV